MEKKEAVQENKMGVMPVNQLLLTPNDDFHAGAGTL